MTEMNDEGGRCYFCQAQVDNDFYCHGCEEYVCDGEECGGMFPWSLANATGRGHQPEDHRVNAEAEEEPEF